jgi:hypothetical protein
MLSFTFTSRRLECLIPPGTSSVRRSHTSVQDSLGPSAAACDHPASPQIFNPPPPPRAAQERATRTRPLPPAPHARSRAAAPHQIMDQTDTRTQKEKQSRPPRGAARRTKHHYHHVTTRCLLFRRPQPIPRGPGALAAEGAGPRCPPRENPQFPRPRGIDANALARFDWSDRAIWARPEQSFWNIGWHMGLYLGWLQEDDVCGRALRGPKRKT